MLAAAKAEAQRSATTVASLAQAEVTVSEPPSPGDGTDRAELPRDTKDLPAQGSDASESACTPPVTAAPAMPRANPYTTPPTQAFPVQLRPPGPYGMSTGNAASSPQPEPPNIYTRANLIGSSVIRNVDKGWGDTNLQNSNRRRKGG
jgi:hypothetical protein